MIPTQARTIMILSGVALRATEMPHTCTPSNAITTSAEAAISKHCVLSKPPAKRNQAFVTTLFYKNITPQRDKSRLDIIQDLECKHLPPSSYN